MIIGIIFVIILAIIIILAVTSKSGKTEVVEKKKKEFAIPPQRRYPFMYFKDCYFYAEAVSRFAYSEEEIDQFLRSLEESYTREDYIKTVNLSNELIKILPKSDKVWTRKIVAIFMDVMTNEKCWNERLSRTILNACFGFFQCYETVIEKSIAVKHILLPVLLKNIDELIKYQNKNVTKYHNFEVYNMLLNLYYVIPYKEILMLISNSLLEDKTDKDFGEIQYVKQTIKSLLKQVDMLRTRNTSRLQETFDSKKITNCTLITDERINANIIAFELTFEPGTKKEMIEAIFYDEIGDELKFGKDGQNRFIDVFEVESDRGFTAKEEIVLLTDEHISKVKLRIYRGDTETEVNDKKEIINSKEEQELKNDETKKNMTEENALNEEQEQEKQEERLNKESSLETNCHTGETLMYPSFESINSIGISDTQFVGLKENSTVLALGIGNKLKQQTTTWKNIKKIYVKNDVVFGIREDGTVIYAGDCEYARAEYVYSWENVESLALGEKHLVALTKNSTMYSIGENSNGECDIEDWYDIIQVATAYHTVGLSKDGQVRATGENNFGECDVKSWQDIVQVAVGDFYTLGLTASGKVLATGLNSCGQCNVNDWANIKKIFAKGNLMEKVKVLRMTPDDVDEVFHIEELVHPEHHWSKDSFYNEIANKLNISILFPNFHILYKIYFKLLIKST